MNRRLAEWLEHRTAIQTLARKLLYEEIPASSGWPQVFGGVALFLFLTQAFTGILLAFNFAPTPGDAHNSVAYIMTQVTGGRLIRGLHHWGASMMVAVVVIHLAQVFLWGAYKKPREATWLAGCALLLLTLAYGVTGYLLPWDNRAYWGTMVVTQLAGNSPVIGSYLSRLLGSSGAIGVVTFARFYSLHVLLLPPLTALLIAVHVYLVRKHGVTPAPDDVAPKVKFFPRQVFKDTVAIFIAFTILFVLAVVAQAPLGRLADPTDTTVVPRPDWYFLFLFQMLRLFEGPLEALGSYVLPALAMLALVLVPFVDRGAVRRVTQRTTAFAAVCLAAVCWAGLTLGAVMSAPAGSTAAAAPGEPEHWAQLSPEELAGIGYFRKEQCATCHNLGAGPAKVGPDLGTSQVRKTAAWMIEHFRHPAQMVPGTAMPSIGLGDAQLNALAAFLLKLTPENAAALSAAPGFTVEGALVYQTNYCGSCHMVNGVGMRIGPALNGVGRRRTREWIVKHFEDPASVSPGTMMPAYRFTPREMDRIVNYLLALP